VRFSIFSRLLGKMKFPQELLDDIAVYLNFDNALLISTKVALTKIKYGSLSWENAVDDGNLDTIKWLHENNITGFSERIMEACISAGDLEVVEWFHNNRSECFSNDDVDTAARDGCYDIVVFLIENRSEGCTFNAIDLAARGGYLNIVEFLTSKGKPCTTNALDWAIEFQHQDVVKYLVESRIEGCTREAFNKALKKSG
jgi:hypothetical protein